MTESYTSFKLPLAITQFAERVRKLGVPRVYTVPNTSHDNYYNFGLRSQEDAIFGLEDSLRFFLRLRVRNGMLEAFANYDLGQRLGEKLPNLQELKNDMRRLIYESLSTIPAGRISVIAPESRHRIPLIRKKVDLKRQVILFPPNDRLISDLDRLITTYGFNLGELYVHVGEIIE